MKTDKFSLIMIAFLFGSFTASAQPQKMKNGKQRLMQHLELTDDQQTQISEMREGHQDQMLQIRSDLQIQEAELDAALLAEDTKRALALVDQINELKGTAFTNRIKHQLKIKAVLNDDQKRKFDQMLLAEGPRNKHHDRPHVQQPMHQRRNRLDQGGN